MRRSLDDHALVYVPRVPSFELSDELDNAHMIAFLLPAVGIEPHVAVPKNLLTTEALYHSATEVLIEFDKYFRTINFVIIYEVY